MHGFIAHAPAARGETSTAPTSTSSSSSTTAAASSARSPSPPSPPPSACRSSCASLSPAEPELARIIDSHLVPFLASVRRRCRARRRGAAARALPLGRRPRRQAPSPPSCPAAASPSSSRSSPSSPARPRPRRSSSASSPPATRSPRRCCANSATPSPSTASPAASSSPPAPRRHRRPPRPRRRGHQHARAPPLPGRPPPCPRRRAGSPASAPRPTPCPPRPALAGPHLRGRLDLLRRRHRPARRTAGLRRRLAAARRPVDAAGAAEIALDRPRRAETRRRLLRPPLRRRPRPRRPRRAPARPRRAPTWCSGQPSSSGCSTTPRPSPTPARAHRSARSTPPCSTAAPRAATDAGARRMKALVVSHAHPTFSIGGAQVASYNLFQGLKARTLGRPLPRRRRPARRPPPRDAADVARPGPRRDAVLVERLRLVQPRQQPPIGDLTDHFERFLADCRPDVVNFHHVMGFGVQALRAARRALGRRADRLHLHEYLLICANHGQMIKARSGALCSKASPSECGVCFPEIGPANLMRRELFLKSFLAQVDAFVSPSRFLLGRFADWGLPRAKLVMIENGLDGGRVAPAARRRARRPAQPLRLLRPAQPLQGHPRARRRGDPHPGRRLGRLDPLHLRRQPRAPARGLPGRGQGALPHRRPPPALHGLLQERRPAER